MQKPKVKVSAKCESRKKGTDRHDNKKAQNSGERKTRDPNEGSYTSSLSGRIFCSDDAAAWGVAGNHLRSGQRGVTGYRTRTVYLEVAEVVKSWGEPVTSELGRKTREERKGEFTSSVGVGANPCPGVSASRFKSHHRCR